MAASIGSASLILGTDGGDLTKGLGAASGSITGWAGEVSSGLLSMFGGLGGKLAAGLAGAFAGGAFASQVAGTIGEIAGGDRMAKALGVSGEEFQRLSVTFQRFGLDADAVSDALSDVADKVADAAEFGGDAAETLGLLGLDAKNLVNLRADQQLFAIADGLSKVDNEATAAGLAVRFGSDNFLKLLPVMRQGAAGFRDMGDEAERAGLVLSRSDLFDVGRADAAWKNLGATLTGLWNKVSAAAAPALEFVSVEFTKLLGSIPDLKAAFRDVFEGISAGLGWVIEGFKAVAGVISFVGGKLLGFQSATKFGSNLLSDVGKTSGRLIGIFDRVEAVAKRAMRPQGGDPGAAGWKDGEGTRGVRGIEQLAEAITNKAIKIELPAAVAKGTKEALQVEAKFRSDAMNNDAQLRTLNQSAKKTNDLIKELIAEVRDNASGVL